MTASEIQYLETRDVKMQLKVQVGSCFPFSAKKLHLLSNVIPSSEIASKKRLNLLKYDSLVCGDLIEY